MFQTQLKKKLNNYVNTKYRGAELKNQDEVIGLRIVTDQGKASSVIGEYE